MKAAAGRFKARFPMARTRNNKRGWVARGTRNPEALVFVAQMALIVNIEINVPTRFQNDVYCNAEIPTRFLKDVYCNAEMPTRFLKDVY